MKKIETIWHYLLQAALTEKQYKHTQQGIAKHFSYSLSTINYALRIPTQMGAVRKESKFFVLQNFTKLLLYWATVHKFEKKIIYSTYNEGGVFEKEGLVPPQGIYACYSAARHILKEPPADYDKVYFYLPKDYLEEAKKRFPPRKGISNLFILAMPQVMETGSKITTLPLTFVDIWNLPDWYSRDFTKALEERMNELLS